MRSAFSRNQIFHFAVLRIVSAKFSHTELVQLAAVMPPRRMSSKTLRPKLEMIRPSTTISWLWSFDTIPSFPEVGFGAVLLKCAGCERALCDELSPRPSSSDEANRAQRQHPRQPGGRRIDRLEWKAKLHGRPARQPQPQRPGRNGCNR